MKDLSKIKVLVQAICGYWFSHHDAIVRAQSGVCGEQYHKGWWRLSLIRIIGGDRPMKKEFTAVNKNDKSW